jgi:hypothetical protein
MREGIVKEITDVVMDKVKSNNLDLVFDKSGMSIESVPSRDWKSWKPRLRNSASSACSESC